MRPGDIAQYVGKIDCERCGRLGRRGLRLRVERIDGHDAAVEAAHGTLQRTRELKLIDDRKIGSQMQVAARRIESEPYPAAQIHVRAQRPFHRRDTWRRRMRPGCEMKKSIAERCLHRE